MKIISELCHHCGGTGILKTGWDTEQIICITCGARTKIEYGDYYDEGFMDGRYVIPQWNKGSIDFKERILNEN